MRIQGENESAGLNSVKEHSRDETPYGEPHLITEQQAADLFGLSVKTLRNWRLSGAGPSYLKIGRSVRYCVSDITAWLETCRRSSTSDEGGGASAPS